jgi:hypothetical protein
METLQAGHRFEDMGKTSACPAFVEKYKICILNVYSKLKRVNLN